MLQRLLRYNKEDSLIRDSFLFFTASMGLNLAGFFYHFYMGRVLGPVEYGILGVMLSLLYIILVSFNIIQTSVAKFAAEFYARKQLPHIAFLFVSGLKKLFIYGCGGLIVYLFMGWVVIAEFARIPFFTYGLLAIVIPFIFLLSLSRGILQGAQNFKHLSVNLIAEGVGKVGVGILLVALGFGVNGAVLGIVASLILAFIVALVPLRSLFSVRRKIFDTRQVYAYSVPVGLTMLILTVMYSIDVILVRYYLDELHAGYYASAALIGKIVFFASLAITTVMFPKAVALRESRKPSLHIFNKSLVLVCILIIGALFFTTLFPTFVVMVLFGSAYLPIASYLWIFTLAFSFFSAAYLIALYNFSMKGTFFVWILAFFLLVEVLAISLFHGSVQEVATVLVAVMAALFLTLWVYTLVKHANAQHHHSGL